MDKAHWSNFTKPISSISIFRKGMSHKYDVITCTKHAFQDKNMMQIFPIFFIDLKDPYFKVERVTENVSIYV